MEFMSQDDLITAWLESQRLLEAAKEREMELRKAVLQRVFEFNNDEREGTQNIELGNGYKLKAGFKIYRRLDNKDEAVSKVLDAMEKTGEEGKFRAERLVKWKPELSLTEYKDLPEEFKSLIDGILTSTPATPSLKLITPKGE